MAVCDCFPELKSVTDAREARYRADPDSDSSRKLDTLRSHTRQP